MVSNVSSNSTTDTSATYSGTDGPAEVDNSVPGEFSIGDDGNVEFTLDGTDDNQSPMSLADSIRKSANEILSSDKTLGGTLLDLFSSDFALLEYDLAFIDVVTKSGAPLFQELENLDAILLSAPTSGEMDALVNFNGGQHAEMALNYLTEFINFSTSSGVSNESLNADIYSKAKSAINKISDGVAPTKEEAAALRAVVSAAKVPMEPYSYANLATMLQSSAHDTERIKGNFARVNS